MYALLRSSETDPENFTQEILKQIKENWERD